ncbi:RNA polymerase sigma factor [Cellulophaga sp. HaHa_2_1]|uniref:RNA polymerase sigma factor n=1 Tax=Cellulophaga sp. HaHa_2_1 TaxID=2749994 RepID=UPI001C4E80F0|nr:RNA polymerase sigma factor [Cellulophaga sp. HaHa_2_1]QXP52868.1 RNA polymerase sigma factor [Cellulophaga sp. HaHa_2_1]
MNKTDFRRTVFSLSERLFPMVSRMLGSSANAEDAIQDIMMKLWEKRKRIADHPNIQGLVFSTARNHCIDILRKKTLASHDASFQLEILTSENDSEELEWKELRGIIEKIVASLPEQQREVILMRDLDGYEFTEIASAMQLKVEHVRVLLSRARKVVSVQLEKTYDYGRE